MGMMGKIKETQKKVEETKKRLQTVRVSESSNDGLLKVEVSAAREIVDISIEAELLEDPEQLADYLILTLNNALKKAGEIHDAELSAVAREGMPNIPGMDQFLK